MFAEVMRMRKQYLSVIMAGFMLVSLTAFGQNHGSKYTNDTSGAGVEFQFPAYTGPSTGRAALLTESFDAGVPGTWTVIDHAGNGVVWTNIAGSGEAGNFTSGAGDCASVSSDIAGSVDFDTEMNTPVIDCSGMSLVTLSCLINYQNVANNDFFDINVSNDNGANWTNVLSWNEDHGGFRAAPGEAVNLDISSVAANSANVIVSFHYYDPDGNWDWYVQVDDFQIDGDAGAAASTVPTLSTWGMIAFTVILMGLVIVIRRKY
jgi:hypothetical protein